MRIRTIGLFMLALRAPSLIGQTPEISTSARPVTALVEDFAIGGRKQVDFDVAMNDKAFVITRNQVNYSSMCLQPLRDAAPTVVFRNRTDRPLRITLRQATGPGKCPTKCSLDDSAYAPLCSRGPNEIFCRPTIALAVCGTNECNAIRQGCSSGDCAVDYYRALESCSCAISKVVLPAPGAVSAALFGIDRTLPGVTALATDDGSQATVWLDGTAMNDATMANVQKTLTSLLHVTNVNISNTTPPLYASPPAVIFDASVLPRFVNEQSDPATFIIEENITTPAQATELAKKEPHLTAAVVALSLGNKPQCIAATPGDTRLHVAVVPLDNTGVANPRYLNPRNPACIDCTAGGKPLPDRSGAPVGVVFHNRTSDRSFTVSLPLPAGAKLSSADEAAFKCTPGKVCKISRNVPPQASVLFDRGILAAVDPKSVIRFDVSLAGEVGTLANSRAYLSLMPAFDSSGHPQLNERDSTTGFETKLSFQGRVDPDLPDVPADTGHFPSGFLPCSSPYDPNVEPVICANHPFSGAEVHQYRARGSLRAMPNLGDRADGSATVLFRSGTLGSTIDKVALDEYQVNIYGVNAMTLKFGKTDFATPSNGLAISEKGEGYMFSFLNVGLGEIIRRESANGIPDRANRDKKDWFFQLRSVSFPNVNVANRTSPDRRDVRRRRYVPTPRSFDFIAMRGEDKGTTLYRTVGGEVFFAATGITSEETGDVLGLVSGSLAAYDNRLHRWCEANVSPCVDAKGRVGLLTLSWIPRLTPTPQGLQAPQTFTIYYGQGTGDNPRTTDMDESYTGESASFTPDKLYLSTLLGKMNTTNKVYFAPNLSNKRYIAVSYTNTTVSLLDVVADALGVRGDVNSRATTLALRQYRLVYPRPDTASRSAAREADVTFQIEIPKGVTWAIDGAYVEPGGAFRDLLPKQAFSVITSVTLSL